MSKPTLVDKLRAQSRGAAFDEVAAFLESKDGKKVPFTVRETIEAMQNMCGEAAMEIESLILKAADNVDEGRLHVKDKVSGGARDDARVVPQHSEAEIERAALQRDGVLDSAPKMDVPVEHVRIVLTRLQAAFGPDTLNDNRQARGLIQEMLNTLPGGVAAPVDAPEEHKHG